jgi:hypothetical protein
MEKYFTGQDFTIFDSTGEPSVVQRIIKLEWIDGPNSKILAHHGLEDSNSDTSDLPTQAWPFNPVLPQVSTGETDSDGNEIFTLGSRQPWDSSGEAFNYVEKKLGLSS